MKHITLSFCLLITLSAGAQQALTASEKNSVIDTLVLKIDRLYVYADKAESMTKAIRQHQKQHDYDTIRSGAVFAKRLTDDLHAVVNDGHLGVDYSETPISEEKPEEPSEEAANAFRKTWSRSNFNIKKLEILDGNIGFFQVNSFFPADWIKDITQASMTFLANTDAIIIDIRQNHGFADGGYLIASYFFKGSVHWNDVYDRDAKTVRQYWTLPAVAGPNLADKDVYILVSRDCFSAAEDFAYNMQALGRARIIGEPTGGGAHPTRPYKIGSHFLASIPFAYGVNPVTHTDWEGKGVQPDIVVPADRSLVTAQIMAVKQQLKRKSNDPEHTKELTEILSRLQR